MNLTTWALSRLAPAAVHARGTGEKAATPGLVPSAEEATRTSHRASVDGPSVTCSGPTSAHTGRDVRVWTVLRPNGLPDFDRPFCQACADRLAESGLVMRPGRSVDEPVLRERRAGWTLQRRVRDTGIENRRNWKGSGIRQRASDFVRRVA